MDGTSSEENQPEGSATEKSHSTSSVISLAIRVIATYIYMYNFVFVFHLLVELLGIKEALPPFLDPTLQVEDLATGTSFASGGSGFDPLTPKAMVYVDALYYYIGAVFFCIT